MNFLRTGFVKMENDELVEEDRKTDKVHVVDPSSRPLLNEQKATEDQHTSKILATWKDIGNYDEEEDEEEAELAAVEDPPLLWSEETTSDDWQETSKVPQLKANRLDIRHQRAKQLVNEASKNVDAKKLSKSAIAKHSKKNRKYTTRRRRSDSSSFRDWVPFGREEKRKIEKKRRSMINFNWKSGGFSLYNKIQNTAEAPCDDEQTEQNSSPIPESGGATKGSETPTTHPSEGSSNKMTSITDKDQNDIEVPNNEENLSTTMCEENDSESIFLNIAESRNTEGVSPVDLTAIIKAPENPDELPEEQPSSNSGKSSASPSNETSSGTTLPKEKSSEDECFAIDNMFQRQGTLEETIDAKESSESERKSTQDGEETMNTIKGNHTPNIQPELLPTTKSLLDNVSEVGTDALSHIEPSMETSRILEQDFVKSGGIPTISSGLTEASDILEGVSEDLEIDENQNTQESNQSSLQLPTQKVNPPTHLPKANIPEVQPMGSTCEEIDMLNLFMSIAGPKLRKSNLSIDDREYIHLKALEEGLPEDFINRVLDQTVGIRRWDEDSLLSFETHEPTKHLQSFGTEPTTASDMSFSTSYTRDEETISYITYDMSKKTPRNEAVNEYGCFGSFKSSFWLESGLAGNDIRDNVAAVMSRDSQSFDD